MSIIKLNEGALLAAGLPRDFVETMRHLVRQAGTITLNTTLPEVADQTDGLAPVVAALNITVTTTSQAVATLETNDAEHAYSDAHLRRRLDEQDAAQLDQLSRAALIRIIDELQADRASLDFNFADLSRRIKQLEDAQS